MPDAGRRAAALAGPAGTAFRRAAVLGGSGAVGQLLAGLLAGGGTEVFVLDRRPPAAGSPAAFVPCDAREPAAGAAGAIRDADLVILALPHDAALAALPAVCRLAPANALLVDTLSVKTPVQAAVGRPGVIQEVLGINPMFAPDLGLAGRAVVAVPHRPGPGGAAFQALLRTAGARVVVMDAARHDRVTATLQALTHAAGLAFGLALRDLDPDLGPLLDVAPPPFRTLAALLARIVSGEPDVYREIQAANPAAAAARQALMRGVARVDAATGAPEFGALVDELAGLLGDRRAPLAALCAGVFRSLERP